MGAEDAAECPDVLWGRAREKKRPLSRREEVFDVTGFRIIFLEKGVCRREGEIMLQTESAPALDRVERMRCL